MAHPTAVIDVVGLSRSLIGEASPRIHAFARSGSITELRADLPAVTCTSQAGMLTGTRPADHGIVGNGWYDRELAEVGFWKQSNRLVHGEKVWEAARRRGPALTCANLFWWYNMYSSVDWSVTPRPIYKADGRKLPNVYGWPRGLDDELQAELGTFPLFHFWGPASSIESSRWIAAAAMSVHRRFAPTLTLIYLPHLDYALQKLGPAHAAIPAAVAEIDAVVGELIDYFDARGVRVLLVSEYGIEPVDRSVALNRHLRRARYLEVRVEQGLELLDAGASRAFAVADHQVAHVYVRDPADAPAVASLVQELDGVERVLDRAGRQPLGLDHPRAGDLLAVAARGAWFSYDYWLDDTRAPDFARTVDIHRKPGYDPLELFLDPAIRLPRLKIARRLLQKKLGFRTLLDIIPLDTSLVRGSHGRTDVPPELAPLVIRRDVTEPNEGPLPIQGVRDVILAHLFGV